MKPTDAPDTDDAATTCFFCGKGIADGHWFARIKQGPRRVIFCRPHCVEKYLDQTAESKAGPASNPDRFARNGGGA